MEVEDLDQPHAGMGGMYRKRHLVYIIIFKRPRAIFEVGQGKTFFHQYNANTQQLIYTLIGGFAHAGGIDPNVIFQMFRYSTDFLFHTILHLLLLL